MRQRTDCSLVGHQRPSSARPTDGRKDRGHCPASISFLKEERDPVPTFDDMKPLTKMDRAKQLIALARQLIDDTEEAFDEFGRGELTPDSVLEPAQSLVDATYRILGIAEHLTSHGQRSRPIRT